MVKKKRITNKEITDMLKAVGHNQEILLNLLLVTINNQNVIDGKKGTLIGLSNDSQKKIYRRYL